MTAPAAAAAWMSVLCTAPDHAGLHDSMSCPRNAQLDKQGTSLMTQQALRWSRWRAPAGRTPQGRTCDRAVFANGDARCSGR